MASSQHHGQFWGGYSRNVYEHGQRFWRQLFVFSGVLPRSGAGRGARKLCRPACIHWEFASSGPGMHRRRLPHAGGGDRAVLTDAAGSAPRAAHRLPLPCSRRLLPSQPGLWISFVRWVYVKVYSSRKVNMAYSRETACAYEDSKFSSLKNRRYRKL